jgi:hypothetical protein
MYFTHLKKLAFYIFVENTVRNGGETEGLGGVQPEAVVSERNSPEKYFFSSQDSKV